MAVPVFADNGSRLESASPADALDAARRFAPECAAAAAYDGRLADPDQWTLEHRSMLPLHRIALHACDDAYVYVSERDGDVVLKTTARDRRIAYAGAVLHWVYFTPFRRHTAIWANTIIYTSLAGAVMCVLGLVWGLRTGLRSPYRGWLRWHHYAGLLFGIVTFTWVFSGMLSMDPWGWQPSTSATRAQRDAFAGGSIPLDALDARALAERRAIKELEFNAFRGMPRVSVDGRAADPIDREQLLAAARGAMPDARVTDAIALADYDAYYYDRNHELPLPVLRVRYDDGPRTWLYVDAGRGTIVRREVRLGRVYRWLYHGFHSLDFPALYRRRPLWDIVVILLSVGGLASVATAAAPAWRRLRRLPRRPL